jgi:ABC-type phosphate/phosphonate transport system substrate-binding protein
VVAAAAVLGAAAAPEAGGQGPAAELKIGLPQPMFRDMPTAMVTVGARPFQSLIRDKAGVNGVVEVLPDYQALAGAMKAGKIDIGVFHGFEYAWVKDTPGLIPLVATVPNCGKVQACLVVNAGSKAAGPKDLKGACVALPQGSKAHCHMFLDHLRAGLPAGDCAAAKPVAGSTPQDALAEVANGGAEAAVVDVSALLALKANFPACHRQLRVLAESEPLPPAIVVYRNGALPPAAVTKLQKGLVESVNTAAGKTFAMFWQLKGFEDVSPGYNGLVERSLKAYPPPK